MRKIHPIVRASLVLLLAIMSLSSSANGLHGKAASSTHVLLIASERHSTNSRVVLPRYSEETIRLDFNSFRKNPILKSRSVPPLHPLTKQQFLDSIKAVAKPNGLLCYVHGSFLSPEQAKRDAAALAATFGLPVVVFDWHAVKFDYLRNQVEVERSEDNFVDFMSEIERAAGATNVTFVAFSKGCYLLNRALLRRTEIVRNQEKFHKIILISADIDALTFAAQANKTLPNASETTILVNSCDAALVGAYKVNGRQERAGAAKHTLDTLCESVPQNTTDIIDISRSCRLIGRRFKHEIPYDILAAIKDPHSLELSKFRLVRDDKKNNLQFLVLK